MTKRSPESMETRDELSTIDLQSDVKMPVRD